ncbi:MAG TPA: peptidoglycan DD-metalloendopeptidase family protein [Solirubrobacteraceae bacterium]|nr:peptidoglycan DD-metalloendopeptidase family protein [Solirubrobacteraceae bacterium]
MAALFAAALAAFGIVVATSAPPPAAAAGSSQQLQQKISSGQQRVSSLAGAVAGADERLDQLNGAIASLTAQLKGFQTSLATKENDYLALRSQVSGAQQQLGQAQAADAADEQALSEQLIGTYEGDTPDIVTVVLEATGFNELLDGLNFVSRVGRQDAKVAGAVKVARGVVAAQAIRLGALSARRERLLAEMQSAADRVATERVTLVSQELAAAKLRSAKAGQLAGAKDSVASLTARLAQVQTAAQRTAGQSGKASSGSSGGGAGSSGSGSGAGSGSRSSKPSAPSSHGFEFPMPKGDVSPPDTWSLDDGVDISAPGGTPELAVCSGTIVLHGIGGFGPSAPVLHCDSALAGYDYVYYGHAGPGDWTPIGTHVSQGQVISEVGIGDVGISTGPHLEIGFADSSGSPVGPSSATAMMSLLRAAYRA